MCCAWEDLLLLEKGPSGRKKVKEKEYRGVTPAKTLVGEVPLGGNLTDMSAFHFHWCWLAKERKKEDWEWTFVLHISLIDICGGTVGPEEGLRACWCSSSVLVQRGPTKVQVMKVSATTENPVGHIMYYYYYAMPNPIQLNWHITAYALPWMKLDGMGLGRRVRIVSPVRDRALLPGRINAHHVYSILAPSHLISHLSFGLVIK